MRIRIRRVTEKCFREEALPVRHGRARPGHFGPWGTAVIAARPVVPTLQEMAGSGPAMTGCGKSNSHNRLS
jgi:hypothetical protein